MSQIDLSIIMPAYNEAPVIASSLQRLAEFLGTRDYGQVEVLVVVCTSPDGTLTIAKNQSHLFQNLRVIDSGPRVGKGYQVRLGMFEATGRYRLFMDADLATPLIHLDEIKAFMDQHGQVGIAVRNLWRIHHNYTRRLISKTANLVAQLLVVPGINDTQCGFKVFEASAAVAIFGRQTLLNWSFDLEILGIARKLGYHITTFDIPDWNDPKPPSAGLTGDPQFKSAMREVFDPLKIRLRLWTGRYRTPSYHTTTIDP
jgi:dolichyl-phosphate beta-glucosyltransferase